ncbi:MAG TPA: quinone-dependent dihydroorotate dehydrogenase [Chthoniobacterales bacterium]|nr:quinone-dependent dihydroorotate dehydrogenase [Chthoniobacterales bacterium]
MSNGYERFVRPILFSLDPETTHDLTLAGLRAASHIDLALGALKRFAPARNPKTVFGLTFPNPIGLAAGFDKNGVALPALAALGFGFIEIGTVTAQGQSGNSKPRIFRLSEELALINRLGFNNDGADAIARRLAKLRAKRCWPAVPIGINIGKSRDTPLAQAAQDYLYCFHKLHPFADYIALNISSPNTPGLRSLQDRQLLAPLLRAFQQANAHARKPILIKIAPDLSEPQLVELIAVCAENEIAGIIATNTTIDHSSIPPTADEEGGLSGAPLREKSTALVRAIRARSTIPVIGCGGITDAASASEKFTAGAQLVQVYTGYVYRGPGLLREIVHTL